MENFIHRVRKMLKELKHKLKSSIPEKRYVHSLGVSEAAVKLAALYGADVEKARLAGLLHDCARGLSNNNLLQIAEASDIVVTDIEKRAPVLLHAPVGAYIAARDYGINDREILRAITVHTTGGAEMSLLDNIIFLADYIEAGRCFPGVEKLRELAARDIKEAMLAAYDESLIYLISKKAVIHPSTLQGRNALL